MLLKKKLAEDTRPTLYRGLKYWGKKPHNVWRKLIEQHTVEGNVVYDPFAGSALTFFEAIKIKRKPVVCDINPITLFLVDVYSKTYNIDKIQKIGFNIIKDLKERKLYVRNYNTVCSSCGKEVDIYNYRWINGDNKEFSYKCPHCHKTITQKNNINVYEEKLSVWKPSFDLSVLASVSSSFIQKMGGSDISNLWTSRNFELLCLLFSKINEVEYPERDALMFAFLQIVHLTTKMCALRGKDANRPLSTSWGRPAYLGLKDFMEQNPIIQFERAINGSAGIINCLLSRNRYLPRYTYSTDLKDLEKVDGVVLLKDSREVSKGCKINLVITDPPYGSIIQYGELSQVWNVWLNKYDKKYIVSLDKEIIVNKNKGYEQYISNMTQVLTNCRKMLNSNGSIILTYNSNKTEDWGALEQAILSASLNIEEKQIQINKRSSEAQVSSKQGIAISDYYFSLSSKIAV